MATDDVHGAAESERAKREEDIRRAAAAGKAHFEHETALKQRLKEKRAEENLKQKEALSRVMQGKEQKQEEKKQWLKEEKVRRAEAQAERERRENAAKELERARQENREKEKRREGYMKQLHQVAQEKFKMDRQKYDESMRKQKEKMQTQKEAQEANLHIDLEERQASAAAQDMLRTREYGLESDVKKKMYALEEWKRMRAFAIQSERRSKEAKAHALRDGRKSEELRAEARMEERRSLRILEKEYGKKRDDIMREKHRQEAVLIARMEADIDRLKTDADARRERNDRQMRQALEEIERGARQRATEPSKLGNDPLDTTTH